MRRFVLIDPCLGDTGSHPYQVCRAVLDAAERAGFMGEAVVRREFRAAAGEWPARHRLEPVLDVPGYSKYASSGEFDTLGPDGRPRWRPAAPWAAWHADRRRRAHVAAFAASVADVVGRLRAGDVVLIATATELDVAGLAAAIRTARPPAGVAWHALFHYPIYRGFLADFARQERRVDRIRRVFASARAAAAPARLGIHVTTPELAAQYERLDAGPVGVLPYPVRAIGRGPRPAAGAPLRVTTLGDARPEKGAHHLADVVARAAADPTLAGRLTFAIQSNPGFPRGSRRPEDRAVQRSLDRLAGREGPGPAAGTVELLPGPLDDAGYDAQVAAADAMLLTYDQDRYHCRCSGVLLEALASGVVPIVTGGGSMARALSGPLQRHAAALVARSRPLATVRIGPVRGTRRLEVAIDTPPGATAVVVETCGAAPGSAALAGPPVEVTIDRGPGPRPAALVAAGADGRWAPAVLPLAGSAVATVRLCLSATSRSAALDLTEATVTVIDSGDQPAVGAVGIVVPPAGDAVDGILAALREFARHADHYRATAIAHAAEVAARHAADRVVEVLLAAP